MMFWNFKYRGEWLSCIADLLGDKTVQSMAALPQHRKGFSRYHHCLLVSYVAFVLCRKLGWKAREAARGGLLHDFYPIDWTQLDLRANFTHMLHHGEWALENAQERFLLTPREQDIIVSHMFPVTPHLYHYRESFAVSTMDKVCAVLELLGVLPGAIPTAYSLGAPRYPQAPAWAARAV